MMSVLMLRYAYLFYKYTTSCFFVSELQGATLPPGGRPLVPLSPPPPLPSSAALLPRLTEQQLPPVSFAAAVWAVIQLARCNTRRCHIHTLCACEACPYNPLIVLSDPLCKAEKLPTWRNIKNTAKESQYLFLIGTIVIQAQEAKHAKVSDIFFGPNSRRGEGRIGCFPPYRFVIAGQMPPCMAPVPPATLLDLPSSAFGSRAESAPQ